MSLSRFVHEPFTSVTSLDRLFDEAFSARSEDGQVRRQNGLKPRMDFHEDENSNIVTATFELPGLKKEDVSIDIQNNVLTVSGESTISSERNESGYAVRERRFGKFSRSIPLPKGTNTEEINASMENGVLTLTFPRTTPEQTPKRITIS